VSPLEIKILLHVYAIAVDYRDSELPGHAKSPAVKDVFAWFERNGLIEEHVKASEWEAMLPDDRPPQHRITAKGEAMVEAICAVQIPVCKWVQPTTKGAV
jgi:hypothetical protein